MTSVVDTSVKFYSSTMLGASALSGTPGALAGVLDACLVTGFDVRAATGLTVANGVATLAYTGALHSATKDSVILVSGVSDMVALNGEQKVIAAGAGFVKFATAVANGTASGTITFKVEPLNWVSPFSDTNLRTYKSSDPTSSGFILRVDDTATDHARVVGYESMSDINTGLGPFPTPLQINGGGWWWKSVQVNSTPVPWFIVGDSKMFYLWLAGHAPQGANYSTGNTRGFGDPIALKPGGDVYSCTLNVSFGTNIEYAYDCLFDGGDTSNYRCFSPRSFTGLGSAVGSLSVPYTGNASYTSGTDPTLGVFPSLKDGALRLTRKALVALGQPPRSDLPGLLYMPQSNGYDCFKTGDSVPGTGTLAGKTLAVVTSSNNPYAASTSNAGPLFFDVTGPWR